MYYKNLIEIHGFVPVKSDSGNPEDTVKIEYKIFGEITWAERMKKYWKRDHNGSLISMMEFNNLVGKSKRRMHDVLLFTQEPRYPNR